MMILDVNMPGGNSTDMIDAIRLRQPKIKILIFSAYNEEIYGLRFLQKGADGYVNKLNGVNEIKSAIHSVLNGKVYASSLLKEKLYDTAIKGKPSEENPLKVLSNREMEVASLVIQGLNTFAIANTLHIKASTVSTYKLRIFEKLGVQSVVELIDKFRLYV